MLVRIPYSLQMPPNNLMGLLNHTRRSVHHDHILMQILFVPSCRRKQKKFDIYAFNFSHHLFSKWISNRNESFFFSFSVIEDISFPFIFGCYEIEFSMLLLSIVVFLVTFLYFYVRLTRKHLARGVAF